MELRRGCLSSGTSVWYVSFYVPCQQTEDFLEACVVVYNTEEYKLGNSDMPSKSINIIKYFKGEKWNMLWEKKLTHIYTQPKFCTAEKKMQ